MSTAEEIGSRYRRLRPHYDERARRLWAANESLALGRGGLKLVAEATGLARSTLIDGRRELLATEGDATETAGRRFRIRRRGGGRKKVATDRPEVVVALEALVDPLARGDPESPLRWTTKSTAKLAAALTAQGLAVSAATVGRLLKERDYSLQGNKKVREGQAHPDRDAQFQHINGQAEAFQAAGQPVVSVDTKKKELVGDFANGGREWHAAGCPEEVRSKDFVDKELGKVSPYGVYDLSANEGWVSVGTDHDTAEFAVATLRCWWKQMGQARYPKAQKLLITADAGGSNGARLRLWKVALQQWADETGLTLSVCHFPPGTSKWNKIEHRMFAEISKNWRGRPLVSHQVVLDLISNTKTTTGLTVRAALDEAKYETGKKVTPAALAEVRLERAEFHGEWNYTIRPRENGQQTTGLF